MQFGIKEQEKCFYDAYHFVPLVSYKSHDLLLSGLYLYLWLSPLLFSRSFRIVIGLTIRGNHNIVWSLTIGKVIWTISCSLQSVDV